MSVLELNGRIFDASTTGTLTLTGEGGAATTDVTQGLVKGWLNFDPADSNAVRDSFNMSFLTDEGTGEFMVGITNNMANVNYAVHVTGSTNRTGSVDSDTQTVGQYSIEFDEDANGNRADVNMGYTSFLGDLA